jgi:hypothetical protein
VVLEVGVIGLGDAFGLGGVGRPRFLLVFNIGFDLSVAVAWQSCNFPSSELIKYFFLMSRNPFFFNWKSNSVLLAHFIPWLNDH